MRIADVVTQNIDKKTNTLIDSLRKISLLALFTVCLGVYPASANEKSMPDEIKSFTFRTPPKFGYFIGDVVEHRIDIAVVKPYTLAIEHLPKPGPRTRWLTVKDIDVDNKLSDDNNRYTIITTYQLFKGVKRTTKLTIPPVILRFNNNDNANFEFDTPAWSFSIAPLIRNNIKDNELNVVPAIKPELLTVNTHFGLISIGIVALLSWLAWFYDWLPFLPKRAGPFAKAFREIKKLSRGKLKPEAYESALKLIHRAINQTVEATVFADQLDDYYPDFPVLAESLNGLRTFFRISQGVFFDKNPAKYRREYPLTWLESFCQDLSRIEKKIS